MRHSKIQPNTLSILSWNINGIRAAHRKGFIRWLLNEQPDLVCLQETRVQSGGVKDGLQLPPGYHAYWCDSRKPGYSGTALLSRMKPVSVEFGLGHDQLDNEGRTIIATFQDFTIVNCYVPNGNRSALRLSCKFLFYDKLIQKCRELKQGGHTVILCGDLNTAHTDIDLANPISNRSRSGFLLEERRCLDRILEDGYIDALRHRHPAAGGMYTWWSNMHKARERNIGWRFDYVFVAKEALERVADAFILSDVIYSDHCPIGIRLHKV